MEKNPPGQDSSSLKEAEVIRDFFYAFNAALKSASIYFPGHPSFLKTAQLFKQALDKLLSLESEFSFGIASDGILIDAAYFQKGNPLYIEIASYLHYRCIEFLKVQAGISIEEVRNLLALLVLNPQEISEKGGLVALFKEKGIANVAIKELDYRKLLHAEGEAGKEYAPEQIWRFLIEEDFDPQAWSPEKLHSLLKSAQDPAKLSGLLNKALEQDKNEVLSRSLLRLGEYLEQSQPQEASPLAKSLAQAFLKSNPLFSQKIHKDDPTQKLAGFSARYLKGGDLLPLLVSNIEEKNQVDELTLVFFNLFVPNIEEKKELATSLAGELETRRLLEENTKLQESIQELFLKHSGDEFVSQIYKKTLSTLLSQELSMPEAKLHGYQSQMKEEFIHARYLFVLMQLLREEKDPRVYQGWLETLTKDIDMIIEARDISMLRELTELLELHGSQENRDRQMREQISKALRSICTPQTGRKVFPLLFDWEGQDFEDGLLVIFRCGDEVIDELLKEVLEGKDEGKKIKFTGSVRTIRERLIRALVRRLNKGGTFEYIMEIVSILGLLGGEESVRILLGLYRHHNKLIAMEAFRYLANMPDMDKEALLDATLKQDLFTRRKALALLVPQLSESARRYLAQGLLGIPRWWFFHQRLMENIEIVGDIKLGEAVPELSRMLSCRNPLFKKRRQELRMKITKALVLLGDAQAKETLKGLIQDKDKGIAELAKASLTIGDAESRT